MADVLSQIPGLAGYLAMQNQRRQGAMQDLQGVSGLMSVLRQEQEAQRAAQMAPLQMEALRAQVQERNLAAQMAQRKREFFTPENMRKYMTPGQPAVAPGQGVTGGMDEGGLGQILGVGPTEQGAPAAQPAQAPRLDVDSLIAGGVSQGVLNPEAMIARQSQIENQRNNLILRQQQLADRRDQLIREAQTQAARDQATAEYRQSMIELRRDMAEARRSGSGGGSGDARREPFRISINGVNVSAWRDRQGNVYDKGGPDGKIIQNYNPEILASDEKAAKERAEATEAARIVERNLGRMEEIILGPVNPETGTRDANAAAPGSVAGLFSGVNRAAEYLRENSPFRTGQRPGLEFSQLIEATLNSAEKAGKLSNQQKNELRGLFATGVSGDPNSVLRGIQLLRQYASVREAGAVSPVGRPRPGASGSFNNSDEALVQKYLKPRQ